MKYYVIPFIEIFSNNNKHVIINKLNNRKLEIGDEIKSIIEYIGKSKGKSLNSIVKKFQVTLTDDQIKSTITKLTELNILTSAEYYINSLICVNEVHNNLFGFKYFNNEKNKICILGCPFSRGNSISLGQSQFPNELRNYAFNKNIKFNTKNIQLYDFRALDSEDYNQFKENVEQDLFRDFGNILCSIHEKTEFINLKIETITKSLISNQNIPVYIGGDHSITYPIIKAMATKYDKFSILHFDAHTDTYSSPYDYINNEIKKPHHGNFMKYCLELNEVKKVYHFGIRGFENLFRQTNKKQKIYYYNQIKQELIEKKTYKIPNELPVYITFDIDCLSPELIKGTATPVFNGFNLNEIVSLLRNVLKDKSIIGIDLVEGNPEKDNTDLTIQIGLYLLVNLLDQLKTKINE